MTLSAAKGELPMVPQEKEAWLALGSSLAFAALVFPLRVLVPTLECEAVFVALAVFIAILWIGRRTVGLTARALDERDLVIRYQAGLVASHAFGIVVMVGAVVLWMLHRLTLAVPIIHVALLAYFGWMSMYVVWSVTVLVLYRRGR
jgi:hypothetical protein